MAREKSTKDSSGAENSSPDTTAVISVCDCVLAYIVGHFHQRPKDKIKSVVVCHFSKEEISSAKETLWSSCCDAFSLDRMVHRVDTVARTAEDANTDDILNTLQKIFNTDRVPSFLMSAEDIVRLPRIHPGELLEASIAERLAVIEAQLKQISSNANRESIQRVTLEGKVDMLSGKINATISTDMINADHNLVVNLPPLNSTKHSNSSQGHNKSHPLMSSLFSRSSKPTTQRHAHKTPQPPQKTESVVQSAHASRDGEDDGFEVPRYLRRKEDRKRDRHTVTGSATVSGTVRGTTIPRSKNLFISRVDKTVSTEDMASFIRSKDIEIINLECVSHADARNKSFKLKVNKEDYVKLYDSHIWPEGICVRSFRQKRNTEVIQA